MDYYCYNEEEYSISTKINGTEVEGKMQINLAGYGSEDIDVNIFENIDESTQLSIIAKDGLFQKTFKVKFKVTSMKHTMRNGLLQISLEGILKQPDKSSK